jgi:hypothetical protein
MKRLHLILSPAWFSLKNIRHTQGDVSFKAWLFMSCEVEKKDIHSTSKLRDKVRRSAIQRGEIGRSFGWAQNVLRRPRAERERAPSQTLCRAKFVWVAARTLAG